MFTYKKSVLWLTLAGVLFSGYLSGIKLFTSTCAFSEPCPYFLGYPACWYGFVMFFTMFVFSLSGYFGKVLSPTLARINACISFVGILFAGYFAVPEIMRTITGVGRAYTLGLPTCVYGLVFYIIIFIVSVTFLQKNKIYK